MTPYLFIALPIVILIISYPLFFGRTPEEKIQMKQDCHMPVLRSDICFNNSYHLQHCPLSSFKQCTNNNYPINKCRCNERSFELCNTLDQYSDTCIVENSPIVTDMIVQVNNSANAPRVNMYNSKKTYFDYLV